MAPTLNKTYLHNHAASLDNTEIMSREQKKFFHPKENEPFEHVAVKLLISLESTQNRDDKIKAM